MHVRRFMYENNYVGKVFENMTGGFTGGRCAIRVLCSATGNELTNVLTQSSFNVQLIASGSFVPLTS